MTAENKEITIPKKVLFVDFNGVISYNPFWFSLQDPSHPLHEYYDQIEELFFIGENKIEGLIDDWMLGKYTSEDIHELITRHTGAPYQEILSVFCEDCQNLDISTPILEQIKKLKKDWYCILRTDNMDTFNRFTLPANPQLAESFDEIHNSYQLKQLKKTDGGKYFTDTIKSLGRQMSDAVLLDDSKSNCVLFESLGGKAYRIESELHALEVLISLQTH